MEQVLIILNEAPYGQERSFHGLRLADALLRIEKELDLSIYLTNDAVLCAKQGQKTPNGYYNIERMLKPLIKQGEVLVCNTCMEARGLTEEDLLPGVRVSKLGELVNKNLNLSAVL